MSKELHRLPKTIDFSISRVRPMLDGSSGDPAIGFDSHPTTGWYLNREGEVVLTIESNDNILQNSEFTEFKKPILLNEREPGKVTDGRGYLYKKPGSDGLWWKTIKGEVNLIDIASINRYISDLNKDDRIIENPVVLNDGELDPIDIEVSDIPDNSIEIVRDVPTSCIDTKLEYGGAIKLLGDRLIWRSPSGQEIDLAGIDDKLTTLQNKLDGEVAKVEADLTNKIAKVEADLDTKIAKVEASIDDKVTTLQNKLESTDDNITRVEADLATKITKVEADVDAKIDTKIINVEADVGDKIIKVEADVGDKIIKVEADLDTKITRVEADLTNKIDTLQSKLDCEVADVNSKLDTALSVNKQEMQSIMNLSQLSLQNNTLPDKIVAVAHTTPGVSDFSWATDTDTGLALLDENVFAGMAGGNIKIAIAEDQVILYDKLAIKDSESAGPSISTEGHLYKKAGNPGLFWKTTNCDVDLSQVTWPLSGQPSNKLDPSYSFVNAPQTGMYGDGNTVGFSIAGESLLELTGDTVQINKHLSFSNGQLYPSGKSLIWDVNGTKTDLSEHNTQYPLLAPDGSIFAPSYSFESDSTSGFIKDPDSIAVVIANGPSLYIKKHEVNVIGDLTVSGEMSLAGGILRKDRDSLTWTIGLSTIDLTDKSPKFSGGSVDLPITAPGFRTPSYSLEQEGDVLVIRGDGDDNKTPPIMQVSMDGSVKMGSLLVEMLTGKTVTIKSDQGSAVLDKDLTVSGMVKTTMENGVFCGFVENGETRGIARNGTAVDVVTGYTSPISMSDSSVDLGTRMITFGDSILAKVGDDLVWTVDGKQTIISHPVTNPDVNDKVGDVQGSVKEVNDKVEVISAKVIEVVDKVEVISAKVIEVVDKVEVISAKVAEVDNKVEVISAKVTEVDDKVEVISAKVTEVVDKVEDVQGSVKEVVDKVEDVQGSVKEIVDKVEVISAKVTEVNDKVGVISAKVTEVNDKVGVISAKVTEVDDKVEDVQGSVKEVVDKVEVISAKVTEVDDKVEVISAKVTEVDDKVEVISAEIKDITKLNAVSYSGSLEFIAGSSINRGDVICMDPSGNGKIHNGIGGLVYSLTGIDSYSGPAKTISIFHIDDHKFLAVTTSVGINGGHTNSKTYYASTKWYLIDKTTMTILKTNVSNINEFPIVQESTSTASPTMYYCKVLQLSLDKYAIISSMSNSNVIKAVITDLSGLVKESIDVEVKTSDDEKTHVTSMTAEYDVHTNMIVIASYVGNSQNFAVVLLGFNELDRLQIGTVQVGISTISMADDNKQIHLVLIPGGACVLSYGICKLVFIVSSYQGSITAGENYLDYESIDCVDMLYDQNNGVIMSLEKTISGSCYIQTLDVLGLSIQKQSSRGFKNSTMEPLGITYLSQLDSFVVVYANTTADTSNIYVQHFDFDGNDIKLGLRYLDDSSTYMPDNFIKRERYVFEVPGTKLCMYGSQSDIISVFEDGYNGNPAAFLGFAMNSVVLEEYKDPTCQVMIKGHIYTNEIDKLPLTFVGKKVYLTDGNKKYPNNLSTNGQHGIFVGTCLDVNRIIIGL